jgi:hypothetical protein
MPNLTVAANRLMSRKLTLLFFIAIARFAVAGDWHYGASMVCSDCHTQHNSENGQPMRTDNNPAPAAMLLRRATALELCLSCHDGSNPNAPDVITPVGYVSESAAGPFPNSGGIPTAKAHHLANAVAEVPPGGTIPMVLTCTTCHDPHGNDNYRNLRPDPTTSGLTPVSIMTRQSSRANGTNPAQVYVQSNVIYKSGVSKWCEQCHGAPAHHSVDKSFSDYSIWIGTTLPRVPVLSPLDNTIPSTDDQVSCISCHKSHGSDNDHLLIYADGATSESTCTECHNP